jgi:Fe-S-cluster-containing hydrogenase component 2
MNSIYEQLARRLDRLPHGFPRTDSGVEFRILRKIFSPGDAALAVQLGALPETPRQLARRLGREEAELADALDGMARRGQIGAVDLRGERCYLLVPFVVGIYEFQLPRLDRELAELVEEYFPHLAKTLGGSPPAVARVVPLNLSLDPAPQVLPHEDVRHLVAQARSFRLMECICRKEKGLLGEPCTHLAETCLAISRQERTEGDFPPWGRSVTREQALDLLAATERDGLVHCTYNVQAEPLFICNCCPCCCGFLRALDEHGAPHVLVRANLAASVDPGACLECGQAADAAACPMGAIDVTGSGACAIDTRRCIGCGLCLPACPGEALTLERRPAAEQTTPPRTIVNWYLERIDHRDGPLRGLAARGWLGWQMARRALGR